MLCVFFQLCSCAEKSLINSSEVDVNKSEDEYNLVKESVYEKKSTLPIKVDNYTTWVDFNLVDNKLIYVYRISSETISEKQKLEMKKYYYSKPKIEEICSSINVLSNLDLVYIYKYINLKDQELVSIDFDKNMLNYWPFWCT